MNRNIPLLDSESLQSTECFRWVKGCIGTKNKSVYLVGLIPPPSMVADIQCAHTPDLEDDVLRICDACGAFLGRAPYHSCSEHETDFCENCFDSLELNEEHAVHMSAKRPNKPRDRALYNNMQKEVVALLKSKRKVKIYLLNGFTTFQTVSKVKTLPFLPNLADMARQNVKDDETREMIHWGIYAVCRRNGLVRAYCRESMMPPTYDPDLEYATDLRMNSPDIQPASPEIQPDPSEIQPLISAEQPVPSEAHSSPPEARSSPSGPSRRRRQEKSKDSRNTQSIPSESLPNSGDLQSKPSEIRSTDPEIRPEPSVSSSAASSRVLRSTQKRVRSQNNNASGSVKRARRTDSAEEKSESSHSSRSSTRKRSGASGNNLCCSHHELLNVRTSEHSDLKSQFAELREEKRCIEKDSTGIELQLLELVPEHTRLLDRVAELERQKTELEGNLETDEERISDELKTVQIDLKRTKEELATTKSELEALQRESRDSKSSSSQRLDEAEKRHTEEISLKSAEIERLQKALLQRDKQNAERLKEIEQKYKEEFARKSAEIKALQNSLAEREKHQKPLGLSEAAKKCFQKEMFQKSSEIQSLRDSLVERDQHINRLQEKIASLSKVQKRKPMKPRSARKCLKGKAPAELPTQSGSSQSSSPTSNSFSQQDPRSLYGSLRSHTFQTHPNLSAPTNPTVSRQTVPQHTHPRSQSPVLSPLSLSRNFQTRPCTSNPARPAASRQTISQYNSILSQASATSSSQAILSQSHNNSQTSRSASQSKTSLPRQTAHFPKDSQPRTTPTTHNPAALYRRLQSQPHQTVPQSSLPNGRNFQQSRPSQHISQSSQLRTQQMSYSHREIRQPSVASKDLRTTQQLHMLARPPPPPRTNPPNGQFAYPGFPNTARPMTPTSYSQLIGVPNITVPRPNSGTSAQNHYAQYSPATVGYRSPLEGRTGQHLSVSSGQNIPVRSSRSLPVGRSPTVQVGDGHPVSAGGGHTVSVSSDRPSRPASHTERHATADPRRRQSPRSTNSNGSSGQKEWEVEWILSNRLRNDVYEFKVKWKNFDEQDECTWEPLEHVKNCKAFHEYCKEDPDGAKWLKLSRIDK
eukprot:195329_1